MTVFVNARFLTRPLSGVQRFAGELLSAYDRLLARDATLRGGVGSVVALFPAGTEPRDPGWRHIRLVALRGGTGHLWEQAALGRAARNGPLLSLCNSGPVLHPAQLLVLHDANIYDVPGAFSSGYRRWHRTLRPVLARRAAVLATVSRFSADALSHRLRLPPDRFSILPNAGDHAGRGAVDPRSPERFGLRPGGYWLAVGNDSPNKNIRRLVAARRLLGHRAPPLVIAGGAVPGLSQSAEPDHAGVTHTGRVSDATLAGLYRGAAAFVFPSLREGFGIPPLEAMQHGVPVLAARSGALPEVLGNAPIWFDPHSQSDMARAMRQFLGLSSAERANMIETGRAQATRFSWEASALRLASLVAGMVSSPATDIRGAPALSR